MRDLDFVGHLGERGRTADGYDFRNVYRDPTLFSEVVYRMGLMVTDSATRPDAFVAASEGASQLARSLACARGVIFLATQRHAPDGQVSYEGYRPIFEVRRSIAVVDIVPDNLEAMGRILAVEGVAERTTGIFTVYGETPEDDSWRDELAATAGVSLRSDLILQSLIEAPVPVG